jgi:ribosomal protein S18 acetylase RimI-like enzyme
MLMKPAKIDFVFCDYTDPTHRGTLIELINHYMADPMGGCVPLSTEQSDNLVAGLSAHPSSFVLLVKAGDTFAGLATCFINFSTFKAKPYINIHDVIVRKEFRGAGLGRALLEKIIVIAGERGYCKVNLEVRDDNTVAKELYSSLGFQDTVPPMHFWTKFL